MVARRVAASQCGEGGCRGVEGVVFEYCVGQGRGRACGGAGSGGPGHSESPLHSPLGPCRGGVNVAVV